MQLSGVRLIITSFLVARACAAATDDGSIAGGLLAVVTPDTLLKPLLNSNDTIKSEARRGGVLRGLLEVRQSSCRIGWAACSSGGCCPIGGQCCSNGQSRSLRLRIRLLNVISFQTNVVPLVYTAAKASHLFYQTKRRHY